VSGTTVALLVLGVGGAVFLFLRSQGQQQLSLQQSALAGGGVPASGGGVQGLVGRLWEQWKGDPLGIQNTKAALTTGVNVVKQGASQVWGVVSDVGSFVKGIF